MAPPPPLAAAPEPTALPPVQLIASEPPKAPAAPVAQEPAAGNPLKDKLLDAKVRLHRRLIEELNLAALEKLPEAELRREIHGIITQWVVAERLALNSKELDGFVSEVMDEMTGLGPLEPLLKDPTISDILINGHQNIFVERRGLLEPVPSLFKDEAHLLRIIQKIVSAVGRRVDESSRCAMRAFSTDRASTSRCGRSGSTARWFRSGNSRSETLARPAGRGGRDQAADGGGSCRRRQSAHHDHRLGRHGLAAKPRCSTRFPPISRTRSA